MKSRVSTWCGRGRRQSGFTLIELLVVVAIIALLISMLLPSLAEARKDARAVVCASSLRHVGQATTIYAGRNQDCLPASYLYASGDNGNWKVSDQYLNAPKPAGYLHWSWFLYNDGRVDEKAFQCPEMENGGHPRTNPGPDGHNWTGGQADDSGSTGSGTVTDKQAKFMAYVGNAALMSRNKFVQGAVNDRYNIFVNQSAVRSASKTILATEFSKNFTNISVQSSNGRVSKSHRSIHPFYDKNGSGWNLYATGAALPRPGAGAPFTYGDPSKDYGGIYQIGSTWDTAENVIDDESNVNKLNCVGRHHPGGGPKQYGGTANFLYLDSHIEKKSVVDTMLKREWGDKFYSVAGSNDVNMDAAIKVPNELK